MYFGEIPQDYWEDELMYYVEENYIDYFLDNMTSSFGIVNMDDHYFQDEDHPFQTPCCNCVKQFNGPYFEIVVFLELEVFLTRFWITQFRVWVIVIGRISISRHLMSFVLSCVEM